MKNKKEQDIYISKQNLANTELLLKNYRKIQMCINSKELDYTEALSFYGIDDKETHDSFLGIENKDIEKQKIIDINNRLINYMAISISALRQSSTEGEKQYRVLYYRFLSMEEYNELEILKHLKLEKRSYHRIKKKAIENLAIIMWGVVGLNDKKLTELCKMFVEFLPLLNCTKLQDEFTTYLLENYNITSKKDIRSLERYKELIDKKLEKAYKNQITGKLNGGKDEKES